MTLPTITRAMVSEGVALLILLGKAQEDTNIQLKS